MYVGDGVFVGAPWVRGLLGSFFLAWGILMCFASSPDISPVGASGSLVSGSKGGMSPSSVFGSASIVCVLSAVYGTSLGDPCPPSVCASHPLTGGGTSSGSLARAGLSP